MTLRVTQGMITSQLMRNLNTNMSRSANIQEQLTTGRKINKPSDDPVGITYSLRYRSELSANEQYQENVDSALSWLDFSDNMLAQAGDVLHRIKELAVQAGTGTNPQVALDNISSEMKQLREQMVEIANSKLAEKYVFNGQQFDQEPYSNANAATKKTDLQGVVYEVGSGSRLAISISGTEIFGNPGTAGDPSDPADQDHFFQVIDRITAALDTGNYNGVTAELGNLQTRFEAINSARADIGAKTNRVELMENRLKDLELNLTSLQSKTEDADFEKVLIDSKINENIFQASLSVGSKIIQPSLVDFIR